MGRSRGTLTVQLAGQSSSTAASWRCRSGSPSREVIEDFGGGTRVRTAASRRAGRGPAGRLLPARAARHAAGLRGDGRRRRRCSATAASSCSMTPWTWRTGAIRDGVLRRRESAASARRAASARPAASEVMDRIIAGVDRGREPHPARRPVRRTDGRLALPTGRLIPIPVRSALRHFPGRLRPRTGRRRRRRSSRMTLIKEIDYGTPARAGRRR